MFEGCSLQWMEADARKDKLRVQPVVDDAL